MSIGVSVRTTKPAASNNGGVARQTNDQREFSEAKATRKPQLYIVPSVVSHKSQLFDMKILIINNLI